MYFRGAILFEPENNGEADRVAFRFPKLSSLEDRYFLGYTRKPSGVACENGRKPHFYSITTCEKVPGGMEWAYGQPDNTESREFCTEYQMGWGMNDIPCNYDRIKRIVCQKNCQS